MVTLTDTIEKLTVGAPIDFHNLGVFPLFQEEQITPDYLTLDEAIAAGSARAREISEQGSVPDLSFSNEGSEPVLLLDGEELVGAKQNRVLNLTILVPAMTTIEIPVSCVEAGRWSRRTQEFRSTERTMYSSGRASKADQISVAMASGGGRRSNQGRVWDEVDEKLASFRTRSGSSSMSDIYEQERVHLDDFVGALTWQEGQCGAVFVIDGAVSGLEVFDSAATVEKVFPKLVRSYALDAMDRRHEPSSAPVGGSTESFLDALKSAEGQAYDAIGLGEDIRISDPSLMGGALFVDGRCVHLSAFPRRQESGHEGHRGSRMSRASVRRRGH